jgi:cephalosporin hydroxylase
MLFNRVIQFLRPKPRVLPLSVDDVLASNAARSVVERFVDFYYSGGTAGNLRWNGVDIIKNPCDLWMMLELFQRIRPRVLVETGTHFGGSALFYADLLRTLGIDCLVVTIDINPKWSIDPVTRGIESLVGYSTDASIVDSVRRVVEKTAGEKPVMVALDSDHSENNVAKELDIYADFVTPGSYLVVEDTIVNGHPCFPSHGPGPWEAVDKFLEKRKDFVVDVECQRFLLTFNPRGWLRRAG